uniref:Transcription factor PIF3 n=1 Tax=Anthurium amnicola TaxID=1678845 RepID=A0A1D1Z3Q0_9ARAE
MKEKREFSQPKSFCPSPDLSPLVPDDEFVELPWEDGRIAIQGKLDRTKKCSFPTPFPSPAGNSQDKVGDTVTPKAARFGAIHRLGGDSQMALPSGKTVMDDQKDEMVPWLNSPFDDYYSEFFSQVSGVDLNSMSATVPVGRISSYGQAERDTRVPEDGCSPRAPAGLNPKSSRTRNSQLFQPQQQCQFPIPSSRPRGQHLAKSSSRPCPTGDLPTKNFESDHVPTKRQKQDPTSCKMLNFAHFSRPVALVESRLQWASVTSTAELRSTAEPPQATVPFLHNSEVIPQDHAVKNSSNHDDVEATTNLGLPDNMRCHGSGFAAGVAAAGKHATEKHPGPAVSSLSMCSANGAGAASKDGRNGVKRGIQELEESEFSDDLEDDSVGAKKPVTGRGMSTKRSRVAEGHSLPERRRRDRINDKLLALQKLIPNCTKVDKASMLDEAIEHLKTLQMQVQVMSTYGGLRMLPMMLPSRMQHIRAGLLAPTAVDMGMGMGLGFGMGMLDMNVPHMIPVPPMHGQQYACASIPGTDGLHGMPGSTNLPTFGIPRQASPMMAHPSPLHPLTGMPTKVNPAPEMAGPEATTSTVQATESVLPDSNTQQLQTLEAVAEAKCQQSTR